MDSASARALAGKPGVYLVLTRPVVPHVTLAHAAVRLGVGAIQLREKTLAPLQLAGLARALRAVTEGTPTLLIINDAIDVAIASGADGVHLGQGDDDPSRARAASPDLIVGVSVSTAGEARRAAAGGADYLGIGPVFATETKPDAAAAIGLAGLAEVAAVVPGTPTVAIGGIDAENAPSVIRAGADHVAVISCVCHAPDPQAALARLVTSVGRSAGPGYA